MKEKRVFVRDLKNYFNFNQVAGNDDSLNRWIVAPDVNRPGLELSGYTESIDLKRVNIIGNKESIYLEKLDDQTRRERYYIITDVYTPCIIVSADRPADPILIEVANERNFPVFETSEKTYEVSVNVSSFLNELLAQNEEYHGVLMNIFGIGVLIQGESGVGKSELALELINRGHIFVGDDLIQIKKVHNELLGEADELLKNYLEIRGVGIIDVPLMFGANTVIDKTTVSLVIKLKRFFNDEDIDRLESKGIEYIDVCGIETPIVSIQVKEGRAMGVIVEAAVVNFKLKKKGINTTRQFCDQIRNVIQKRNQEGV